MAEKRFQSFAQFYPFYLSEHRNRTCRRFHFAGSSCVLGTIFGAAWNGSWPTLLVAPVVGYGLAWIGHFFFEKNTPATFKHPLYSLIGDWVMFKEIMTGKIPF